MTTYGFQWLRGEALTPIAGATNQSYTPTSADIGFRLRCSVTAYNLAGASIPAITAAIGPIAASQATNLGPTWASGTTATVFENTTGVAFTMAAVDPEGASVVYSLGGADAALFNVNASTGAITFKTPPDFEGTHGNTYALVQTASDGVNTVSQALTLTVSNVPEVVLTGVTVTPVAGLSGTLAAGTKVADIAGRVAGDAVALSQALITAGFVLNGAGTQVLVGLSGRASGSFTGTVAQSHPDAAAPVSVSVTIAVAAGGGGTPVVAPVVTPVSFNYIDTAATDVFSTTSGTISATNAPASYGLAGGTGSATLTKSGAYGVLSVNTSTGAYSYVPDNAAINALESGTVTDVFSLTATNTGGTGSANLTVSITGAAEAVVIPGATLTVTSISLGA